MDRTATLWAKFARCHTKSINSGCFPHSHILSHTVSQLYLIQPFLLQKYLLTSVKMRFFISILAPLLLSSIFAAAQECQLNGVRTPTPPFSGMVIRSMLTLMFLLRTVMTIWSVVPLQMVYIAWIPVTTFAPRLLAIVMEVSAISLGFPPCRLDQLWSANLWSRG